MVSRWSMRRRVTTWPARLSVQRCWATIDSIVASTRAWRPRQRPMRGSAPLRRRSCPALLADLGHRAVEGCGMGVGARRWELRPQRMMMSYPCGTSPITISNARAISGALPSRIESRTEPGRHTVGAARGRRPPVPSDASDEGQRACQSLVMRGSVLADAELWPGAAACGAGFARKRLPVGRPGVPGPHSRRGREPFLARHVARVADLGPAGGVEHQHACARLPASRRRSSRRGAGPAAPWPPRRARRSGGA
jgi:hypothetical protein